VSVVNDHAVFDPFPACDLRAYSVNPSEQDAQSII